MMAETIQRSIFDFHDRILPKVVKTITMTDWDGNEDRIMPVTVEPWAPEHYPIQETCKNCSRWQNDRKACQVQGAINTPNQGNSWCHWHWNGQPFKKVKSKKKVEEDEDDMEECE